MKLKYRLPLYAEMPQAHLSCDQLEYAKKLISYYDQHFKTALEANAQLCRYHPALTIDTDGDLLQINITDSIYENQIIDKADFEKQSDLGSYRDKLSRAKNTESVFSEHSFTKPAAIFHEHWNFFLNIKNLFKSEVTRMRLVKLPSGKSITPHIDYDPGLAVRVIIPIVSDRDCLNIFWYKNSVHTAELSEGKAYFLNTGFRHAVCNLSKNPRYTLMLSLNGIKDIESLLKDKDNVHMEVF